jgi:hypothetical protein
VGARPSRWRSRKPSTSPAARWPGRKPSMAPLAGRTHPAGERTRDGDAAVDRRWAALGPGPGRRGN